MSSVGAYLRDLRRQRGVSLEEIARATRVAHRYLDALESENFAVLPAPVFTRGFIRAYCQALGVSPDEALARYAGAGSDALPDEVAPTPGDVVQAVHAAEAVRRGRGAVLVSFVLLVVLGLALFAMTLVLHGGREAREPTRKAALATTPAPPEPAPPLPAEALASPASPDRLEAVPQPAPAPAPTVPPTLAALSEQVRAGVASVTPPYRLIARTTEPTWVRVRMEDGRLIEETIPPRQNREWISNRPFVLTIGNAGGIALELNGRALPRLGASGAVINGLVVPPPAQ